MDVLTPAYTLTALGTACFVAFTWALRGHFRTPGASPAGVWLICGLSLFSFVWFLWDILHGVIEAAWPVAAPLFVLSFALFFSAIRASRPAGLTVAFAADQPRTLLRHGPYRYIRHPFYSSYIAFWTAVAIARPGWQPWAASAALYGIYWVAARHEEGKFERSGLVAAYAAYRQHTGMFLPRLPQLALLTRS
jgi:protein-S-isoprenylcysteine O-methyltransferase Ste14